MPPGGRLPRAAERTNNPDAWPRELTTPEALAQWPWTADQVGVSRLRLSAKAGVDTWGRQVAQPLELSATVAVREPFASAAASDRVDASTVHYGLLSKGIVRSVEQRADGGAAWLSALDVASAASEAVVANAAPGAVAAVDLDVCFPKASTLGSGAGVAWKLFFRAPERLGKAGGGDEQLGEVVAWSRALYVREMRVPTLIGVNSNERKKKQMVVLSLWVDRISEGGMDQYHRVEEIALKAVENTDFETLEALAERISVVLFQAFINGESPGSNLRVRLEKPTAVPFADASAIEVYRTLHDLRHVWQDAKTVV